MVVQIANILIVPILTEDPRGDSTDTWAQGKLEAVELVAQVGDVRGAPLAVRGCGQTPPLHHAASPWRLEPGSSHTK